MSEVIQTTSPEALAELREQVENMRTMFASLRQKEADRPKKGKVREDLNALIQSDFPLILLSRQKYTNKKGQVNVASVRSQFKVQAKEMELDFTPSIVEDENNLYLVNFDAENAEAKFNEYILRAAGIDAKELYALTSELDAATK